MLTTEFTKLVGCRVPIQLAAMPIVTVELAHAVAEAGGFPMLSTLGMSASFLADTLEAYAQATDAPIGVNFLVPFLDRKVLDVAVGRAKVVEFFYGDPDADLVRAVHAAGSLACWQIGSVVEAIAAERAGCDLVAAQGIEAGGHVRGHLELFPLLAQVLDAVQVPVIAAGGIGTGRSMAAALAAGAAGVRVGTRFVAARESGAHQTYVDALVRAYSEDTVLTEAFAKMWPDAPHRVLTSCIAAAEGIGDDVVGMGAVGDVTYEIPRFATPTPNRDTTGRVEAMALYAGRSVYNVRRVQPAAEIVSELCDTAERLLCRWSAS